MGRLPRLLSALSSQVEWELRHMNLGKGSPVAKIRLGADGNKRD